MQATLLELVSTSLSFIGLGFMKDGGFYQMLGVSSLVFCALLSIPVLKQKLGWYNWAGIFIIIAGITLKSVPSIQDFLTADEADVDGCVGVQELSQAAMTVNLTATETGATVSQACDKTCQTLIGILLIIVSEVIFDYYYYYYCLRSRPIYLKVVRQLVSQSVSMCKKRYKL